MVRWKPVEGYEGIYEISDDGQCRSLNRVVKDKNGLSKVLTGKRLKPKPQISGHLSVHLCKNGRPKQFLMHRLVAFHFVAGYFEGAQVRHLDGNCQNNTFHNLKWGTSSDNSKDMYHRHGKRTGAKSHFSKYSREDLEKAISLKGKCSSYQAEKVTGISRRYISTLWRGEAGFQRAERAQKNLSREAADAFPD